MGQRCIKLADAAGDFGAVDGQDAVNHIRRPHTPQRVLAQKMFGEEQADSERTIAEMGEVRLLGRLPRIDPLNPATLRAAFDQHFDSADFLVDTSP